MGEAAIGVVGVTVEEAEGDGDMRPSIEKVNDTLHSEGVWEGMKKMLYSISGSHFFWIPGTRYVCMVSGRPTACLHAHNAQYPNILPGRCSQWANRASSSSTGHKPICAVSFVIIIMAALLNFSGLEFSLFCSLARLNLLGPTAASRVSLYIRRIPTLRSRFRRTCIVAGWFLWHRLRSWKSREVCFS